MVAKGALSFTSYDTQGSYGWNPSASGFMVGPEDKGLNPCEKLSINDATKSEYLKKKTDIYKGRDFFLDLCDKSFKLLENGS